MTNWTKKHVKHGENTSGCIMRRTSRKSKVGSVITGHGVRRRVRTVKHRRTDTMKASDNNLPAVQDNGRYSPTQTAAIKNAQISGLITTQKEMLKRRTHGVNLYDFEQVRLTAEEYMGECADTSTYPSFLGLAAYLGLGRSWLYQFIRQNGEHETAKYLDRLRHTWASGKIALAEKGVLSDAAVLFQLKNAKLGFADRTEIEMVSATGDEEMKRPPWAWGLSDEEYCKRLLEDIPMDDDE